MSIECQRSHPSSTEFFDHSMPSKINDFQGLHFNTDGQKVISKIEIKLLFQCKN